MSFEKILSLRTVKNFIMSLIAGVIITSFVTEYSQNVMADITNSVVRLHILANSDSEEDQRLKTEVRDDIIDYLKPMLDNAVSVEETEVIIRNNLENIKTEAEKSIKKHGYTYSATVVFGKFDFPEKSYENATFPGGRYNALRIIIGEGEGRNWWCVLYPQLCFSESTNGELPEKSKNKLKNVLTDDEYDMITSADNVNFKLKIVEMFSH